MAAGSNPIFPSVAASQVQEKSGPARSWLQNPSFTQVIADMPREHPGVRECDSSGSSDAHSSPKHARVEEKKRSHRRLQEHSKHKKRKRDSKVSSHVEILQPETLWIDEAGVEPGDAYRLDPKPDAHNLHYDSLYRGHVASYRRGFGQHCIGLGKRQAVEWTDNRSKASREKKLKQPRYFKPSAIGATSETLLHLTHERAEGGCESGDDTGEFLSLEDCRAPEDRTQVTVAVTPEEHLSQRTARYNRSLLEEPHNTALWLEFIAFQDQAVLWGRPPAGLPETAVEGARKSRLALVERKLAIMERALESNPLSVELLLRQMALAQELWEDERILHRWKDLVFQQPNKLQLWLGYVEFCQSRFSSFTLPSLTSLYTKCLSTVSAIQDGVLKSHKPDADSPRFLLAVFTLYCSFLKQAGQSEKAVACFQALIEFNLCCPPELEAQDLSAKARVEFFEAFWDSSVPRFGEEGARGWSSWVGLSSSAGEGPLLGLLETSLHRKQGGGGRDSVEADTTDPELSLIAGLPLQQAWLRLEHRRGLENSLPWRPEASKGESEEDCTDPDQLVLFDDIRQSLFRVRDPELQLQLVLTLLHFLGAPLPTSPLLLATPHLISSCLESPCEVFLPASSSLRSLLSTHHITPLFPHQLAGVGCEQELLVSGALEDTLAEQMAFPSQCPKQGVASGFISCVFNQALSLFPDPLAQTTLTQLWLQFELSQPSGPSKSGVTLRQRAKAVQRLVKAALRAEPHRNNLLLWNCCALQEHLLGNASEAIKLYETVLSQYHVASADQSQLPVLFRCFTECLLGLQPLLLRSTPPPNVPLALHCLAAMAEGKYTPLPPEEHQLPPAQVLRTRSLLQKRSGCSSPHQVACHAYFEYLTQGLKQAMAVFDGYLAALSSKHSPDASDRRAHLHSLELTYYLQAQLMIHHSRSHPSQPAMLRTVLEAALRLFPEHGWFLAAYIECERPSFFSGRLRRYFDTHAPKAQTAIPWVFAIAAELQRHRRLRELAEEEVGGLHRVRALLQKATRSPNGRGCPLLWRLFMKFEVEQGGQAKAVFYQAIQQCPWAKVLYMDAVCYFPGELDKIMEILEEKELRLRAPLEEVKLLLDACACKDP